MTTDGATIAILAVFLTIAILLIFIISICYYHNSHKRVRTIYPATPSVSLSYIRPYDPAMQGITYSYFPPPNFRERLHVTDPEYKAVLGNMRARDGTTWVDKVREIYKIRNPKLEHLYSVCKAHMRRLNPGLETIEEILWHGTTDDTACDNICRDGFNRAHGGKNSGMLYGKGVYFARNFSYSATDGFSKPDMYGVKRVFQCGVLHGYYTLGRKDLIEPPIRQGRDVRYDSVVDKIQSPDIFVVFKDEQSCPQYLILFTR